MKNPIKRAICETSTATWRPAHGAINGLLSHSSPKAFDSMK